jgi:hypothetical protein
MFAIVAFQWRGCSVCPLQQLSPSLRHLGHNSGFVAVERIQRTTTAEDSEQAAAQWPVDDLIPARHLRVDEREENGATSLNQEGLDHNTRRFTGRARQDLQVDGWKRGWVSMN